MDTSEARTVLGVDVNASQEEIKRTYRILVKTYHPDRKSHLSPAGKKIFEEY